MSYTISCNERGCSFCKNSGTLQINSSTGEIDSGTIYRCYKDYLNYSVTRDSDHFTDVILETQEREHLLDEEKYMDVDKVRIYLIDAEGKERLYISKSVEKLSPLKVRVSSLPMIDNVSVKKGRVELYNEKCEANQEHYMYFTYTGYGGGWDIYLEHLSLQSAKEYR